MFESRHLFRKARLLMNLERLVESRPHNLTFEVTRSPYTHVAFLFLFSLCNTAALSPCCWPGHAVRPSSQNLTYPKPVFCVPPLTTLVANIHLPAIMHDR